MELYKGLPLKTITVITIDEVENHIGVTTDMVNDLITSYFNNDIAEGEIYEFDESYDYAVPQEIFEKGDKEILNYINQNIDFNFKI
jgi:hypothetical protein